MLTSSALMGRLSKELKEPRNPVTLEAAKAVIKKVRCAELEAKYPQTEAFSSIIKSEAARIDRAIIKDLESIRDVFDFNDLWPKASSAVQDAKQRVAARNRFMEAIDNKDFKSVMKQLNEMPAPHLDFILSDPKISKNNYSN